MTTHLRHRFKGEGGKLPSREQQDTLADNIRFARIEARAAIARAGGVGLAAYLAALVASVTVSEVSLKRYGAPDLLKGGRNRPAAGPRTQSAISLLQLKAPAADSAATLDLDADPGCRAIDAARDALIDLLANGEPEEADRTAREAIREFDRAVGLAVAALRSLADDAYGAHSRRWGSLAINRDDGIAAGLDGLRRACCCYRPVEAPKVVSTSGPRARGKNCPPKAPKKNSASLESYARWHGWIGKAIHEADPACTPRNGDDALDIDRMSEKLADTQAEESSARLERLHLADTLLAAGLAKVEGKDTKAARGLRGFAEGREVPSEEWGPAVRLLRSLLGNSGIDGITVCG